MVTINRPEGLDACRAAIRYRLGRPPRRDPLVETFAGQMAADAKVLDEAEEIVRRSSHCSPRCTY